MQSGKKYDKKKGRKKIMRKGIKKFIALFLVITMCTSMNMISYADNETNDKGVTYKVTLDTPAISTSTEDQTITMRLTSNKEITVDGIAFTVTKDSPLTITSITGGEKLGAYEAGATNLENGKTYWHASDSENVSGVTDIAVVTLKVPANTPAGTYSVGVKELELTENYGDIWEKAASATTTLTIEERATKGYTASLSTLTTDVTEKDTVEINVGVSHSSEETFSAGEIVLTYDETTLKFNEKKSVLGTATVKDEGGTLKLEDYGADKTMKSDVYKLSFDAISNGTAELHIQSAAFINKENAVKEDLDEATVSMGDIVLNISKRRFEVTLPEIFEGYETATDGEDYTFTATDSNNYDYSSVSATIDGEPVDVIDHGDGTYTVKNVTGKLVITGTRSEKEYKVSFMGNAADEIIDASEKAQYNHNYSFTLPGKEGWAYSVDSITINGEKYTGYSVEGSVYTIPGTAIKGDIVIDVNKTQTIAKVTVEGSGAGAAAGYQATAEIGKPYTLTLAPEKGYNYTVVASMGGTSTEITKNDNSYTIANVTGDVVFTVERTVIVDGVTVTKYLTLDGKNMWLVKNEIILADGKVPTYKDENMYYSEGYNAYCYLVLSETLTSEDAAANVGITDGSATVVDYGMDVNNTGKVDASDAQLVYNMYNVTYNDFTMDATMEKFLRADTNKDTKIDVNDAVAIIAHIIEK